MTTLLNIPIEWTVADLQDHLDGIPAHRIRLRPWPGTATVQDVVRLDVRLVWYIDPASRTVAVSHNENDSVELDEDQMLTGNGILPGFEVAVRQLFTPPEAPH